MKNRCDLDERQLWIRGDIYKHCFIIVAILLGIDAFLKSSGINWANPFNSDVIIIVLTAVAGMIEMICRDVYPKKLNFCFVILGVCSAFIMVATIINLIWRGRMLLLHGQLTDEGFSFTLSICWLTLFFVFIIKSILNKHVEKEE